MCEGNGVSDLDLICIEGLRCHVDEKVDFRMTAMDNKYNGNKSSL